MTSTLALACAILRRPRREAFKFLAKTLVRVIVTKQKLPALVYYLMSSLEPSTGLGDELENVLTWMTQRKNEINYWLGLMICWTCQWYF
jgi:hypothetical protein